MDLLSNGAAVVTRKASFRCSRMFLDRGDKRGSLDAASAARGTRETHRESRFEDFVESGSPVVSASVGLPPRMTRLGPGLLLCMAIALVASMLEMIEIITQVIPTSKRWCLPSSSVSRCARYGDLGRAGLPV